MKVLANTITQYCLEEAKCWHNKVFVLSSPGPFLTQDGLAQPCCIFGEVPVNALIDEMPSRLGITSSWMRCTSVLNMLNVVQCLTSDVSDSSCGVKSIF